MAFVTCPGCKRKIPIAREDAGQVVECAQCGSKFSVRPSWLAAPPPVRQAAEDEPPPVRTEAATDSAPAAFDGLHESADAFRVQGIDDQTGQKVAVEIDAASETAALRKAASAGISVSSISRWEPLHRLEPPPHGRNQRCGSIRPGMCSSC